MCLHNEEDLYTDVLDNTVPNSQEVEAAHMPVTWWLAQLNVACLSIGTLLNIKKGTKHHATTWIKGKKLDIKDSIYVRYI